MIEIPLTREEAEVAAEMVAKAQVFLLERGVEKVDLGSFANLTSHLMIVEVIALRIELNELRRKYEL